MIDPRKAALIIIDMQHGFLDSSSALCVAGAAATVPACTRALNRARELGMPVFHAIREYAADDVHVRTALETCVAVLDAPAARAATGRVPRLLNDAEYNFFLEDMKTLGQPAFREGGSVIRS